MSDLRWQDVAIDSIWREKRQAKQERLVRIYRVYPPQDARDQRLVSVMIRTVERVDVGRIVTFRPKSGSRLSYTTVDRLARDFVLLPDVFDGAPA